MNWTRKNLHTEQSRTNSGAAGQSQPKKSANDGMDDYTLPSSAGIEVKELTMEEFEALLAAQRSPA